MIIYLYGPDSYRRLQKQKEVVAEYKNRQSALTIDRFCADESKSDGEEFLRCEDFFQKQSLFNNTNLAVISGISEAAVTEKKQWLELFKKITKDKTAFAVISENKKLGKEFDFLLKKPNISQEFSFLESKQLKNFIIKEAKSMDVKITTSLLNYIINTFRNDSWSIISELEKISLAPTRALKENNNLFSNDSIFKLIYQLKSNDLKTRLSAFEFLLNNEDSAKVFNLAAYSLGAKGNFADYDAAIKSGKTDYDLALLGYLLR